MKYSANSVWENKDEYDVVVVGAGHAGCEAALATASSAVPMRMVPGVRRIQYPKGE